MQLTPSQTTACISLLSSMKVWLSCLALLSSVAQAGELIIHGPSAHSSDGPRSLTYDHSEVIDGKSYDVYLRPKRKNNLNFGLGYRADNGLLYGTYQNSYREPTAYIGAQLNVNAYFGAFGALATGYDRAVHRPLTVIGGLVLKAPVTNELALELVAVPKVGRGDGLLHLALAYKLK